MDQISTPSSAKAEVLLPRSNRLLRIFGVTFGLAVTIGGTIGIGILRVPAEVAVSLVNGSTLLVLGLWLLGGAYVLISAFSVVELGTMLPQAGGYYVYTRRAFGDAAGFTAGWVDWLTQSAWMASVGISMAEFSATLWSGLAGKTIAFAIFLIVLLSILQWRGTQISGRTQEIAGALQACAFFALIVACFNLGHASPTDAASASALEGRAATVVLISILLALRLVGVTYDGWTARSTSARKYEIHVNICLVL